ncbi:MAG TPA: NAD(P)-dependent oxidoreductase [Blastococcus sp.]|nr:NAD(P)-dependent oxidoreductase [Blastococcus sp.]
MSRPRVGFAMTTAARKRYAQEASVRRLEDVADVVWLDLEGPDRVVGPPPRDAATVARLTAFVPNLDVLVVGYGSPRVTVSVLAAAPRLQMVGDTHGDRFAARVDVAACEARGITVVDTTNGSSDPVAEWALALTLVGLRNAGSFFRRLIAGEVLWEDRDVLLSDPGYLNGELTGKTVGIIALGNVGRRFLELLAPFHVHVLAYDPGAPEVLAAAYDIDLTSLDNVLSRSDVVVCLVPLTIRSAGLLGRREIELMKPGGVFVNVSRGPVVDTDALVDRLRRGDLVACLDVVDPEPLAADSPLRSMPNVFLSPHIAGVTAAAEPRFVDLMIDEVLRVLAGHRPRFRLAPREGPGRPEAGNPHTEPHADVHGRRREGGS